MNAAKRVAVLKGGGSLERTVSLRSGARVQQALSRLGHEVVAIDAGQDLVAQLHACEPDAAFVALHGGDGEDGTVQGILETIGVPYTGSGPSACMRCTDKALAKYLMREAGIPTPGFTAIKETAIKEWGVAAALGDIGQLLGFPLVVKPASQGSALGVKFARSSEELPGAIVGALSYDRKVVIERYVKGRDLAVSVLDCLPACPPRGRILPEGGSSTEGPREGDAEIESPLTPGEPLALPVVEAIPREEEFYNYESRYEIGMTTFVCPAELSVQTSELAQQLALDTYTLLGCHGVARVDLMLDDASGELSVLETNVGPGLTETSLLPLAADAGGIGFDELITRILASAFTR
jgi:D-alanine-D-alanine ligase